LRFQTSETVSIQDQEMVLRALEMCLRDISNEVVRSGDQITLHGLGPSPRAVNYNDKTVLSVSAEDDKTIINADVSFQASAFLGDVSQDALVRSKLEQVFEQMKSQIDLEKKREAAFSEAPGQTMGVSSPASPTVVTTSTPLSLVTPASMAAMPAAESSAVALLERTELPVEAPPVTQEAGEDLDLNKGEAAAPAAESSAVALLERTELPVEGVEEAAASPIAREAGEDLNLDEGEAARAALVPPMLEEELHIVHARQEIAPEESEASHSKLIWVISAILVLLLLAVGAFLPRVRHQIVAWYSAATRSRQPVAATTVSSSASGASPAPATDVGTAVPVPPTPTALPVPNVEDPKAWLENWGAAMRSRDPVAQASFYADPVERYIDQKNVSNAVLVTEKRADIGRRHDLWTFKVNDVVVESRTPTEATVRLVKHYSTGAEPTQVSELFVKTRLQLKVINGQWKIVSEREIRDVAPARVDPIDQSRQ
jgi:hypothetical protein